MPTSTVSIELPLPSQPERLSDKRRTLTFMITELGFARGSLSVEPNRYPFFTRDSNFIVTSTAWSRHRLAEFGFPAEKIRIVPLGVDTTIFRPLSADECATNRANLGIHEDETVFVNVGGAFWNKGIDLLLRAFAELRTKAVRSALSSRISEAYTASRLSRSSRASPKMRRNFFVPTPWRQSLSLEAI